MTEAQGVEVISLLTNINDLLVNVEGIAQFADLRTGLVIGIILALLVWQILKGVLDK